MITLLTQRLIGVKYVTETRKERVLKAFADKLENQAIYAKATVLLTKLVKEQVDVTQERFEALI